MSHCLGSQGLAPGRGGQGVVPWLLEGVWGAPPAPGVGWGVGSSCLALGMLLCRSGVLEKTCHVPVPAS